MIAKYTPHPPPCQAPKIAMSVTPIAHRCELARVITVGVRRGGDFGRDCAKVDDYAYCYIAT